MLITPDYAQIDCAKLQDTHSNRHLKDLSVYGYVAYNIYGILYEKLKNLHTHLFNIT